MTTYLDAAAGLLRKASEDNERRAREARSVAASMGGIPLETVLREVNTRRVVIAFGFIAVSAVSAAGEALCGHAPEAGEGTA